MKTKLTDKETKLTELLKGTELEDLDCLGYDNAKDLIDNMQTQINENEVIYYSNAIKYLAENDASLKDSLAIADELGYEVKNINSELLASLLQQQNMNNALNNMQKEIEAIFED